MSLGRSFALTSRVDLIASGALVLASYCLFAGSHNVNSNRDMRDALGALGPVDGCVPELSNITCSMSLVEADDIVFLTTDGISDNFDPVIGKFCIIENDESVLKQITNNVVNGNVVGPTQKGHKGRWSLLFGSMGFCRLTNIKPPPL